MKRRMIPKTDSIRELAAFWDTHDLTDFEGQLHEVREPVFMRRGQRTTLFVSMLTVPVEVLFKNARNSKPTCADSDLEVECFVPADTLPAPVLSSCIRLGPVAGGEKAYQLLVEAMKAGGYRALVRPVSRTPEVIFLIRLLENNMILERLETLSTLSFERDRGRTEFKRVEIELATELIKQLSVERYDPQQSHSTAVDGMVADRTVGRSVVRLDEWISKRKAGTYKRSPEGTTKRRRHVR